MKVCLKDRTPHPKKIVFSNCSMKRWFLVASESLPPQNERHPPRRRYRRFFCRVPTSWLVTIITLSLFAMGWIFRRVGMFQSYGGIQVFVQNHLHPWRLTWNIIMEVWKIIFLSKWVICRFHVNLPGCSKSIKQDSEFRPGNLNSDFNWISRWTFLCFCPRLLEFFCVFVRSTFQLT